MLRRRRSLLLAAVLCAVLPAAADASPTRGQIDATTYPSVRAVAADSFARSVGVNVHIGYPDTQYVDFDRVVARLEEAGIRTVRDGLNVDKPWQYDRFRRLAARGFALSLVMGDPRGRYGTGPFESLFATLKTELPGAVAAVEGANEYDISGDPAWASAVGEYQRKLYTAVKGDPVTRDIQVLAPSFAYWQNIRWAGDLSAWSDAGNVHAYPGGRPGSSNLDDVLTAGRGMVGSKPIVATETGYHNALGSTSGHAPTTERTTAAYLPKLFLEYFRRGIPRTYAYELLDLRDDPSRTDLEKNFGLLRNDFSPKPAFTALKTLLATVRDPGSQFGPGTLAFTVTGQTADVKTMLLQKRDGTFVLAAWHDLPLTAGGADVAAPTRQVQLRFPQLLQGGRVISTAQSTPPSTFGRVKRVDLTLGAAPLLVEIRPTRR